MWEQKGVCRAGSYLRGDVQEELRKAVVVDVMHNLEAMRILKTKLAAIEQEHQAECADNEEARELIDAKAEARTLATVFDFLRDCKISHTGSLLRILERYLRPKSNAHTLIKRQQRHPSRGQA
jgi:hypothetical protein